MSGPALGPAGPAPRSWWPWVIGCAGGMGLVAGTGVLGLVVLLALLPDPDSESRAGPDSGFSSAPELVDGKLFVPPATSRLTVGDLVGEWDESDGITTTYVDRSTGSYAGTDSLHFRNTRTIDADGGISVSFLGLQNGRSIREKTTGTVSLADGVLAIRMQNTQRYVVRGWLLRPEMTIIKVNGPWYEDPIPTDIFSNLGAGTNLDHHWVRKN